MQENIKTNSWLPTTVKEAQARGWDEMDVVLFSGDAYVDHPSFGVAVVGRVLEAEGLRVAIVPQPNWQDDLRDFTKFGTPRLFFGVSGGAMDSMVNHYTANKRLRSDDAYTAGGKAGRRPDRAVTVYSRILKRLFPHVPVVAGGIEASLRRLAHYDYWDDEIKPSLLLDSGADVIAWGMGERVMVDIARALSNGFNANMLHRVPQIAYLSDELPIGAVRVSEHAGGGRCDGNVRGGNRPTRGAAACDAARSTLAAPDPNIIILNSFEECVKDPHKFAENFVKIEQSTNPLSQTQTLVEPVGWGGNVGTGRDKRYVVVNPPYPRATEAEVDRAFDLPYTRLPHPRYRNRGAIPAFEMIKFSVNIHRGCFGGCSFCTIAAHQGKFVTPRSEKSILNELEQIVQMPDFKGNISDLGAPSANMFGMRGRDEKKCATCMRASCAFPRLCRNLDNSHARLLDLYRKAGAVNGIRHIYIGSGIRYDLFGSDAAEYLREVVTKHTSGRLKVAPEHTEDHVLKLMRKPPFALFEQLHIDFRRICDQAGLRYQLIPYFISSHPGCTQADMRRLATRTRGLHTDQVQDLTPTPMTLSSVMFATGLDPYTWQRLFVARSQDDKRRQKSYFFK